MPLAPCIDTEYRRSRIAEHLLNGINSTSQLAASFGVTQVQINVDIKAIRKQWIQERPKKARDRVTLRVSQIEQIHRMLIVDYLRSRNDKEEITTTYRTCDHPKCQGGFHVDKVSLRKTVCHRCNGDGQIELVTKKETRQPGNPVFLSIAKECLVECARLEGIHPSTASRVRNEARKILPDGTVLEKIEEIYQTKEMPYEYIIDGLTRLDQLQADIRAGHPPKTILNIIAEPKAADESEEG